MVGTYEVRLGSVVVGQATVEKQGLYYHFSCRCRLTGQTMQRIVVTCEDRREDLGVCVPMDGTFGLEKRIPCKRLGTGRPEFNLMPSSQRTQGKFVPVYPEEPFSYMSKLKGAFLDIQNGQRGIVISE